MSLPVAILAGGLATRLRPVTERIPKALVKVAGRPFIEHQLNLLRRQGYTRIVLCLGYLGEMVERHLGNGKQFGVRLDYVFDGPRLLGTGGAVKLALPCLGDAFFVLYGDSYLLCDFKRVEHAFLAGASPALMTVFANDNKWDSSNVLFRDGKVVRYDKRNPTPDMRHVDYGLTALNANALDGYAHGVAFDLAELYAALAAEQRLAGFEVTQRFYEVGSPSGLADTEKFMSSSEFSEFIR